MYFMFYLKMMLPTLHHPSLNQSRSDYNSIGINNDQSESRLKSRLDGYGIYTMASNDPTIVYKTNKHSLERHLPNIKQND